MTRKKKLAVLAFIALVVMPGLILAFSGPLARLGLEYVLRHKGFPAAHVDAVALIPDGLIVENISLDANGFSTIEAVQAKVSWIDYLFQGEIASLTIKNAELSGELGSDGRYVIAGWDASLPFSSEGGQTRIHSISLDGMVLDLETPQGAIRIEGKLALQGKADNSRDFQASLWGRQKQLSLSANASGNLLPDGGWTTRIELLEGRLDMGQTKVSRAAGIVDIAGRPGQPVIYKGKMFAGGLRLNDTPFQDLNVDFDSRRSDILKFHISPTGYESIEIAGTLHSAPDLQFTLDLSASNAEQVAALVKLDKEGKRAIANLFPATAHFSVPVASLTGPEIKSAWNFQFGAGKGIALSGTAAYRKLDSHLAAALTPASIPLSAVSALLPKYLQQDLRFTAGTLAVSGSILYPGESRLDGKLKFDIKNAGGVWQNYPFSSAGGTVTTARLWPWELDKSQTIRIGKLGAGVRLENGGVMFSGSQKQGLTVSAAAFDLADGEISLLSPFTWKAEEESARLVVTLNYIDIGILAAQLGSTDFKAAGRLNADLPLSIDGQDGIAFHQGKIRSSGAGYFKYLPSSYPTALQGNDARLQTVRAALSDFQYSDFEVTIDGNLNGNLRTELKAVGKNPALADRPINLNVNLQGALVPALQQALQPALIDANME